MTETDANARLREVESRLRDMSRLLKETTDALAKVSQQQRLGDSGDATGGGSGDGDPVPVFFPTGMAAAPSSSSPSSKSDVVLAVESGNGFTASGGTTITCYNCYTVASLSGTNKFGWVVKRTNGKYYWLTADC